MLKLASNRREQVKAGILKMIDESSLRPGDRLESEKKLGELLNVNHLTVRAALSELADSGVVKRVPRSGTFYTGKAEVLSPAPGNGGGELVSMMFRSDEHFFGCLSNEIILALQYHNFIVANQCCRAYENEIEADLKRIFEIGDEIKTDLERMFKWGNKSVIVSQTEIEKSPALCEYFNRHAAGYHRVVRLMGNQCCEYPLVGHQVTLDYQAAYREAIAYLKNLGHRRIAYCGANCNEEYFCHQANRKFTSLYMEAMVGEGLAENISVIARSDEAGIRAGFAELLRQPNRPTAVFCLNDYRGVLVSEVARDLGLKVPGDLSIIGFFDTPWSQHHQMTSFRLRYREMANRIAELFTADRVDSGLSLIKADLIERNSCAKMIDK